MTFIVRIRRATLLALLPLLLAPFCGGADVPQEASSQATATQPLVRLERPIPQIERAILISIDGCRPDVLLRAKMPNVRKLMDAGSYSVWARTVPVAVTLPAHASMLTGVMPEKHGITWNKTVKEDEIVRPKVPTIFEVAMRYGMSTAVVAGKSKFDTFTQIGHVGRTWTKSATDEQVAAEAIRTLRDYRPDLLFIHFPGADKEGHAKGWASPEQVTALENIDEQLGKVITALEEQKLRDETAVLITSDHGGAGRGHGTTSAGAAPEDPRNQHIPWILSGPGIRKGYDLSHDARLKIHTVDTFATLCYLLGLKCDGDIDGKPVTLAIETPGELLQDAK